MEVSSKEIVNGGRWKGVLLMEIYVVNRWLMEVVGKDIVNGG